MNNSELPEEEMDAHSKVFFAVRDSEILNFAIQEYANQDLDVLGSKIRNL
jgi:hypothetical protein